MFIDEEMILCQGMKNGIENFTHWIYTQEEKNK
jgi:hypothetical protein